MEKIYLQYFQHLLASDPSKYQSCVYKILKTDENNPNILKLLLNQGGINESIISSINSKVLQTAFQELVNTSILTKAIIKKDEISMSYILNYLQYIPLAPMIPLQLSTLATNLIHQLPITYIDDCNVYYTNYFVHNNNKSFVLPNSQYTILPSTSNSIIRISFQQIYYLVMLIPAIELGNTEVSFSNVKYNCINQPQRCCIIELSNSPQMDCINLILKNLTHGHIYPNYIGFELDILDNKLLQLTNNKWKLYTNAKEIKARYIIKCFKPLFHNIQLVDKNIIKMKANEIINTLLILNNPYDLYFNEINEMTQKHVYLFVLKFGNYYFGTKINQSIYQDLLTNKCLLDFKTVSLNINLVIKDNKIAKIENLNNLLYNFYIVGPVEKMITFFCLYKTQFFKSDKNLFEYTEKSDNEIYALNSKEEYNQIFNSNTIANIFNIGNDVYLVEVKIPFNEHVLGYVFISPRENIDWCEFEIAIKYLTTHKDSNTSIQLAPNSFRLLLALEKTDYIDYIVNNLVTV